MARYPFTEIAIDVIIISYSMRSRETTCYVVHECMREVDKFRKLDVGFWTLITKSLDKRIGTTARAGSCSCDTTFYCAVKSLEPA
jgi:regulator of RNase E activity RraA